MKDADDNTKAVQWRDCTIAGPEGAPVFVLIHGARLTRGYIADAPIAPGCDAVRRQQFRRRGAWVVRPG